MHRLAACGVVLLMGVPAVAQDMPLSQVLIDGEGWQAAGPKYAAVSSLAADAAGNVYVAVPEEKRIDRLDAAGKTAPFAKTEAAVVALAFGSGGRLFACQPDKKRIVVFDGEGAMSVVADGIDARGIAVARDGLLYVADTDQHIIYQVRDGKKQAVDEGIAAPAGLTFWPDGGTLVAGDAAGKQLFALRVEKEGKLGAREGYYTLRPPPGQKTAGTGPLIVDKDSRLYAASDLGVQIFDPTGRMSGVLLQPVRAPATALTFGGPEHDRLYVAFGGQVYQRKTKARGTAK